MLADAGKPFGWGESDCLVGLVIPAVKAITGEDFSGEWCGKYHDPAGAKATLASLGHADMASALAERFKEVPVARAGIGDIAMIPSDSGDDDDFPFALGIVIGDRIMVQSPNGRSSIRLARAARVFRVGE
jgi:hypothetical protein